MAKENIKASGARPSQKSSSDKEKSNPTINNTYSGSASDNTGSSPDTSNTFSDKESDVAGSKNESDSQADNKNKNYVRGENQKPVTKAYRDNWDKIFKKV